MSKYREEKEYSYSKFRDKTYKKAIETYDKGRSEKDVIIDMQLVIQQLRVENDSLREMISWEKDIDEMELKHTAIKTLIDKMNKVMKGNYEN